MFAQVAKDKARENLAQGFLWKTGQVTAIPQLNKLLNNKSWLKPWLVTNSVTLEVDLLKFIESIIVIVNELKIMPLTFW